MDLWDLSTSNRSGNPAHFEAIEWRPGLEVRWFGSLGFVLLVTLLRVSRGTLSYFIEAHHIGT